MTAQTFIMFSYSYERIGHICIIGSFFFGVYLLYFFITESSQGNDKLTVSCKDLNELFSYTL